MKNKFAVLFAIILVFVSVFSINTFAATGSYSGKNFVSLNNQVTYGNAYLKLIENLTLYSTSCSATGSVTWSTLPNSTLYPDKYGSCLALCINLKVTVYTTDEEGSVLQSQNNKNIYSYNILNGNTESLTVSRTTSNGYITDSGQAKFDLNITSTSDGAQVRSYSVTRDLG